MSFLRKIGRTIESAASLVPGFGVAYNPAEQPVLINPFNGIRVPGLEETKKREQESLQWMLRKGIVKIGQIELVEKKLFGFGPKRSVIAQSLDLGQIPNQDGTVVAYRIPENARVSKVAIPEVPIADLHSRWDSGLSQNTDRTGEFKKIITALNIPKEKIDFFLKPVNHDMVQVEKVKLENDISLGDAVYPAGTTLYSDGRVTKAPPLTEDYRIPVIATHKKRHPVGRAFKIPGWHRVKRFPTGPNPYPVRVVPETERIGLLSMSLLMGNVSNEPDQSEQNEKNEPDNIMLPYITPAFDAHISVPPYLVKDVALRIPGGQMDVESLVNAVRAQVAPVIMQTALANEVSVPVASNNGNGASNLVVLRPAEVFALEQISTVPNLDPHLASRILLNHMTNLAREALEANGMPGEILTRVQMATPADAGEIIKRVQEVTETRLDMLTQGPKIFKHLQTMQILTGQEAGTPANVFLSAGDNRGEQLGDDGAFGMNLSQRLASIEQAVTNLVKSQDID